MTVVLISYMRSLRITSSVINRWNQSTLACHPAINPINQCQIGARIRSLVMMSEPKVVDVPLDGRHNWSASTWLDMQTSLPVRIVRLPQRGRALIAREAIKKHDIIFAERPIVASYGGPSSYIESLPTFALPRGWPHRMNQTKNKELNEPQLRTCDHCHRSLGLHVAVKETKQSQPRLVNDPRALAGYLTILTY
jgi:hypothetical protein